MSRHPRLHTLITKKKAQGQPGSHALSGRARPRRQRDTSSPDVTSLAQQVKGQNGTVVLYDEGGEKENGWRYRAAEDLGG